MRYSDVLRRERRAVEAVRADLRQRRWLRWHAFLLASVCVATGWGVSAVLHAAGVDALAARWPLALAITYGVYLLLLGAWCRWLVSRDEAQADLDVDADVVSGGRTDPADPAATIEPGGGGDFAGGGAGGRFDGGAAEGFGEAGGHALDALGAADEGVVVLVPLALVVGLAALIATGLGLAVGGLFGVEVMLGVCVEIVLASAAGALAYKARREGWWLHALRRTWPTAVLLVALALVLGLAIAQALPQARSLVHALRLLWGL